MITDSEDFDTVTVDVPIIIEGDGPDTGFARGMSSIMLKGRRTAIPEQLVIDIDELQLGESITAGDIDLPVDCEFITYPDTVIVHIYPADEIPPG